MIQEVVKQKLDQWCDEQLKEKINYMVDKSKNATFGDVSSNIALVAAKKLNQNPMDVAQSIINYLPKDYFQEITVTKPGFINFKIGKKMVSEIIDEIIQQGDHFGKFPKKHKKYSVEYVSANPTGLLHIGHARNAVLGSTIINLLQWYGYDTVSEYVVNDAGNQMNNLAAAVLIRYQQLFDININLPEDSYHGEEIKLVAQALKQQYGDRFVNTKLNDKNWIANPEDEFTIRWFARDYLLNIIKQDLKDLGVEIELYFSEYDLHKNKMVDAMIQQLLDKKAAYEKDGAIWLNTTKYGDDKDRVLIKSDKTPTYFAPDIVYHHHKWTTNNTDVLVNIWGADHYSYISRMKIAMQCLGFNPDDLIVVCMQMVKLMKNGEEFKMSKRTGNSLTTRDLVQALGKDVARWYLVSQSANNHIIIDVEQATKADNNNPIYYVQYAHARANQLLNKIKVAKPINFVSLNSDLEREIITELDFFKYTIENCATTFEPYKLTVYLLNLARLFHSYYANNRILDDNNPKLAEQYYLVKAIKQVLNNGLTILGITPKEKM